MKICHVITRFIRGGADENTLHSCNGSIARGHEVHLIVGAETDPAQIRLLSPEVHVWRVPALVRDIAPLHDLWALLRIARILGRIRPMIVHTHTSKAGILGRLAARLVRVPVVVHGVHILPFVNVGRVTASLFRAVEGLVVRGTDAFVSVGEDMKRTCLDARIGVESQHYVIPSGMDLKQFDHRTLAADNWRAVLGPIRTTIELPKILLLVSRLEPRKGQYKFLSVFSVIAGQVQNAILILAGEGPDQDRIADRILELGLKDRVFLVGHRSDIQRLMGIADVGLLTSRREGLPRVLVQYALMRLPIVSTDVSGARQIVEPGESGYLVPSDDLPAFQAYIVALLNDDQLRSRFSHRLSLLDLRSWSMEAMNEKLEELYVELANRQVGRADTSTLHR